MNFLDLNFDSVAWPKPGDRLFQSDVEWENIARLDLGGKDWGSYAGGYKKAADLLAQRFLENWQGNDTLIYPMVFLYRHYVELRLKQIIVLGQTLLHQHVDFKDYHNLNGSWGLCRKLLMQIYPKEPNETWNSVEYLIRELDENDPGSMNFRYPYTKKDDKNPSQNRQATLPKLNGISVRNLYDTMQRLASFLDNHVDGISVEIDEGNGFGA